MQDEKPTPDKERPQALLSTYLRILELFQNPSKCFHPKFDDSKWKHSRHASLCDFLAVVWVSYLCGGTQNWSCLIMKRSPWIVRSSLRIRESKAVNQWSVAREANIQLGLGWGTENDVWNANMWMRCPHLMPESGLIPELWYCGQWWHQVSFPGPAALELQGPVTFCLVGRPSDTHIDGGLYSFRYTEWKENTKDI